MVHLICVPVVNFVEPTLTKPIGWLMVTFYSQITRGWRTGRATRQCGSGGRSLPPLTGDYPNSSTLTSEITRRHIKGLVEAINPPHLHHYTSYYSLVKETF